MKRLALVFLLTFGCVAARADYYDYTFYAPTYNFSFSFPTAVPDMVDGVTDPFGTVPFTADGVTYEQSELSPYFVVFSAIPDSFSISDDGKRVNFSNQTDLMVYYLLDGSVTGPGTYHLFELENTTGTPDLTELVVTDVAAATPEPNAVVVLGCAVLAVIVLARKRFRAPKTS
jgi:hypothetical protein